LTQSTLHRVLSRTYTWEKHLTLAKESMWETGKTSSELSHRAGQSRSLISWYKKMHVIYVIKAK
jgi:hypothetical protein